MERTFCSNYTNDSLVINLIFYNMINNFLTDEQKVLFLDIYKTVLGARLSCNQCPDSIDRNTIILDATLFAMKSVELLMDNNELKSMKDIVEKLSNERIDKPSDFPNIV